MIEVVNRAYLWLRVLFDDEAGAYHPDPQAAGSCARLE